MIVMNTSCIEQFTSIHTCINDYGTIITNYKLLHRFLSSASMYIITKMSNITYNSNFIITKMSNITHNSNFKLTKSFFFNFVLDSGSVQVTLFILMNHSCLDVLLNSIMISRLPNLSLINLF